MNYQQTAEYLSTLGYTRTQPGYYENNTDKKLFCICDDNKTAIFYDGTTDETSSLVPLRTLQLPVSI
jgi:hypothetical protein